ncbi:hypothetical protein CKO31_09200 [Thiohalocapsa halophila]|uniref:PIN domain-containing protein n=1 Tax=Thiohalocapsa halophila TaxID=69359 RepID=A0ABS1CG97_9GAMM|nr:PIN domain-containing protein [Thiohalocapsa halophila]MBK1630914.1 hypothetical protein [Thiohalocapsa halophila]
MTQQWQWTCRLRDAPKRSRRPASARLSRRLQPTPAAARRCRISSAEPDALGLAIRLTVEFESVLKRAKTLQRAGATVDDVDAILDQMALMLVRVEIWYLWRPQLRDRDDDMVLEAAANAGATHIVTFNIQDFGAVPMHFGIQSCRPADIVRRLRTGWIHDGSNR